MKWTLLLAVLCACGHAATSSSNPATNHSLAAQCPSATCPEVACPACPAPPPPKTWPWHCFDLDNGKGTVHGFCYTLASVCESMRGQTIKEKRGTATACSSEPEAVCMEVTSPVTMGRQYWCTRSVGTCRELRKHAPERAHQPSVISECTRILNTDKFDAPSGFPLSLPPPAADS